MAQRYTMSEYKLQYSTEIIYTMSEYRLQYSIYESKTDGLWFILYTKILWNDQITVDSSGERIHM